MANVDKKVEEEKEYEEVMDDKKEVEAEQKEKEAEQKEKIAEEEEEKYVLPNICICDIFELFSYSL